jgi:hypothetical protein
MGFSPVLSAAALLSLVAVVIAAPTARPQPKDIESLCLAVKVSSLTALKVPCHTRQQLLWESANARHCSNAIMHA